MNNYESLFPNKKALFHIPVARTASAYLTSLILAVAAFVAGGSFKEGTMLFWKLEEFQEEFKDINQEEQILKLHKILAPHLLRRVYLWLQITNKMKARASLEVIGNNYGILYPRTHQTYGNLWLKHLLISWNDHEKSYLCPTLSACYLRWPSKFLFQGSQTVH